MYHLYWLNCPTSITVIKCFLWARDFGNCTLTKKNVLLDSVDILSSTQLTKIQLYKVDGSLYIGTYTYKMYIFIIKNVLFVLEVIIEH